MPPDRLPLSVITKQHIDSMVHLNGLHAAGYNSAESEPIWMKFGKLSAKCWGLATAEFGRDPRSSHSLRGSRKKCLFFWSGK